MLAFVLGFSITVIGIIVFIAIDEYKKDEKAYTITPQELIEKLKNLPDDVEIIVRGGK